MARTRVLVGAAALFYAAISHPDDLRFKQRVLGEIIERVPEVMAEYDEATGRFQSGRAWDQRRQRRMHVLAVAYSTQTEANGYCHDNDILGAIVSAGNALIEAQDDRGRWQYTKSDGSQWGWRYQEWTYSRWVDTFELVREDMPSMEGRALPRGSLEPIRKALRHGRISKRKRNAASPGSSQPSSPSESEVAESD